MTPQYASPEQVQGGAPVTTVSDVYSLGVLLYKLLTSHLPCRIAARPTAELERAVLEEEPERPATAVARGTTGALLCWLADCCPATFFMEHAKPGVAAESC